MAVPRQRRKTVIPQAAAEAVEVPPAAPATPQLTEVVPSQPPEPPQLTSPRSVPEKSPRLLPDPFTFKTVNLGGSKVHFQHSRQAGEYQIRFGDGGRNDMPSDAVREFIKSHKHTVTMKEGKQAEVQLLHWNKDDRAWGMSIPYNPEASRAENDVAREKARDIAKPIFDKVVELVRAERGAAPGTEPVKRPAESFSITTTEEDKTMPDKPASEKKKPVHEITDGALKVTIWKNDGEYGPRYSVTCRRRYKDKSADEWKDTYSYGQDDVLGLSKLLDLAHTWMLNENQQKRAQKAA